jgi:hypothetical protein
MSASRCNKIIWRNERVIGRTCERCIFIFPVPFRNLHEVKWSMDFNCTLLFVFWCPEYRMWLVVRVIRCSCELTTIFLVSGPGYWALWISICHGILNLKEIISMNLSPYWEAASCTDTAELHNVSCNPKVHYIAHKSPLQVPVLSQTSPDHTTPPVSVRSILIRIILQPTCR